MTVEDGEFEWDDTKARINRRKHGILFSAATVAFSDPRHVVVADVSEDYGEERWLCIGLAQSVLLLIVFVVRGDEPAKRRIISARRADEDEEEQYREG